MHWKSLSRPKFEMVNGGGLLQVPTAFSGRYVEFVQSSAFGQKRSPMAVAQLDRSSYIKVEFALRGLGEFYNDHFRTAK